MRVLLAFDKFKDSLTAPEACAAARAGLQARHADWQIDVCPLSDGGEGFAEILTSAVHGTLRRVSVTGPRGRPAAAGLGLMTYAQVPAAARSLLPAPPGPAAAARIAVIDMASASGLALLAPAERDVWQTSSVGTGELIRLAAAEGAAAILLGVGGSATHDLGLGALAALGLEFQTAGGAVIRPPVPARWADIARIRGAVTPPVPPVRIACDVSNPLLGPCGAAATYGPQKGLRPEDLPRLDAESGRLARLLCAHCGRPEHLRDLPGTGAAGGISFGLMAAAGAELVPGFEFVSAWLDLESRLAAADLVITGEGRFDDSSLQGKGPGAVAARALSMGKQVHVFAGRATVAQPPAKLSVHSITPDHTSLEQALRDAAANLQRAVSETL
ncbi:MAG: glycerate kinase [Opitutaceae bacterium]|nr:glycerate kinase [Opitutaceae bacterium]